MIPFSLRPVSYLKIHQKRRRSLGWNTDSRRCQEIRNNPKNFCLRLDRIIETRGVDESDYPSVDGERQRNLDFGGARLQTETNGKLGPAKEVYELPG